MIDLKIDGDFRELKKSLNPYYYKEAFREASNDITVRTVDDTHKDIEDIWNIDIKKIGGGHYVAASNIDGSYNKRAGHLKLKLANEGQRTINLNFKGSAINLSRFATSLTQDWYQTTSPKTGKLIKKRKPPTVKIKKRGGTTQVNGSFVAKMKSGHVGIFQRVSKDNKRDSRGIVELRTITLPSMLHQVDFDGNLDKEWAKNITRDFDKHFDRYISQGFV